MLGHGRRRGFGSGLVGFGRCVGLLDRGHPHRRCRLSRSGRPDAEDAVEEVRHHRPDGAEQSTEVEEAGERLLDGLQERRDRVERLSACSGARIGSRSRVVRVAQVLDELLDDLTDGLHGAVRTEDAQVGLVVVARRVQPVLDGVQEHRTRALHGLPELDDVADEGRLGGLVDPVGGDAVFGDPDLDLLLTRLQVRIHQLADLVELVERHALFPRQVLTDRELPFEVVRVERQRIEVSVRAGVVHALDEVDRVQRQPGPGLTCADDTADDRDVGADLSGRLLESGVGLLQHRGVGRGVQGVPELDRVGLVPHLIGRDLVAVAQRDGLGEGGELVEVGRLTVERCGGRRPHRGRVQHTQDAHAAGRGGVDHLVELVPARGAEAERGVGVQRLHTGPRNHDPDVGHPERLHHVQALVDLLDARRHVDLGIGDANGRRRLLDGGHGRHVIRLVFACWQDKVTRRCRE